MKKKIGIGVITYNQESFIIETINSILSQTNKNFDLFISDDFSTDNTYQVIKNFIKKKKINCKLYRQKYNLGVWQNTNFLFQKIKNYEFACIFAGDDIMNSKKIETQVNLLEKNINASFCYSDCYWFHDFFPKIKLSHFTFFQRKPKSFDDLINDFSIPTSTIIYRTSYLNKFRFTKQVRSLGDILLILYLWKKSKPIYSSLPLSYYRRHKNSLMLGNYVLKERKILRGIIKKKFKLSNSSLLYFDKLILYSKVSINLRNQFEINSKEIFALTSMALVSNKWLLRIVYVYFLMFKFFFK
jgi:teichuronic acid biosynthesis glycosyltransferase TuaG